MSLFKSNRFVADTEVYDGSSIDALMADDSIQVYDSLGEAAGEIIYTTAMNWTALMRQVGIAEAAAMKECGEVVYEAADIKAFFSKLIDSIKALLHKIARFFKTLVVNLMAKLLNSKKFYKMYEKEIENLVVPSGFKYTGYIYTNLDERLKKFEEYTEGTCIDGIESQIDILKKASVSGKGDADKANVEKAIEKATISYEKKANSLNKIRGNIVGKSEVEANKFSEEIKKYFRNGKSEPTDCTPNAHDLDRAIVVLRPESLKVHLDEHNKRITDGLNSLVDMLNKAKSAIKDVEGADDTAKKATSALSSVYTAYVDMAQQTSTMLCTFTTAQATAIKEADTQTRAVLAKVIKTKGSYSYKDRSAIGKDYKGEPEEMKMADNYAAKHGLAVEGAELSDEDYLAMVEAGIDVNFDSVTESHEPTIFDSIKFI